VRNYWLRTSAAVLFALAVAGCGGGGGGDTAPVGGDTPPGGSAPLKSAIDAAASSPANDTSQNSTASFTVLQNAGLPAVVVTGPPKVNFAVFSDGRAKTDLVLSNVSFAIAKLVPGTNGDLDQWVSYVSRTETAAAGVGPNGTPVLPTAKQATTDSKQTDPALAAAQLKLNPEGYYTYTFRTDIKDPTKTAGVVFEPNRTHRVAIQLSYKNAAGETVLVNPYFDFTVDANGNSVTATAAQTRQMVDIDSCNGCHDKLALHGGGRVDTQYCVLCHNPGTTDANSGNVLTLSTMVHKIHAGRLLKSKLDTGKGGEDYVIWGYQNSKHDYAEVGFPQDLRNCSRCHTAANPATPQGDNWKTKATREACLTCHASKPGSDWLATHTVLNNGQDPLAPATLMPNSACQGCHGPGSAVSPERVHWNQNEENAANYKMNIEGVSYDAATRKVTVKYFLSNPKSGNSAYNLVTADCTYTGTAGKCVPPSGTNNTQFGNLRFYLAYQNMVGQNTAVTEFTAYNNGGSSANVYAHMGTNDGSNHYTATITVPADSTTSFAAGTARVVSIGQIKEPKLEVKSATDPRPQVSPLEYVSVVAQHTYADVALSGALTPRREIVSNDKCNVCHGALGTTSGSNTLANAFHGGARNTVEACVVCHDPNRMSSTVMTNGLALSENYQFKRMIHGIHANSKRTYPFTHGNKVAAAFSKTTGLSTTPGFNTAVSSSSVSAPSGTLYEPWTTGSEIAIGTALAVSGVENYAAEVAYPQVGLNCDSCHVNGSYKVDRGTVGSVVSKPILSSTLKADPNPLSWMVISPKAATCTACHDSPAAIGHVTSYGAASFGNRSQAQSLQIQETCADCHSPGVFKGVDIVHGQK
jgi:OmcA/MtrC family decaheme c-type cytochrome